FKHITILSAGAAALFAAALAHAQSSPPAAQPPAAAPAPAAPAPASTPAAPASQYPPTATIANGYPGLGPADPKLRDVALPNGKKIHVLPATLETTQWGWFDNAQPPVMH